MSKEVINYKPPPTLKSFIRNYRPGELFYDWVVGPYGSGKTTGDFFKLIFMAGLQEPNAQGIRKTKATVVRQSYKQLDDTTIDSWNKWFKEPVAGHWELTKRVFHLKFGDVECDVLFRALDTPADVSRVLSLETTFAIIDEFKDIPRDIIEALAARLGRYPANCTNFGMWGASNTGTESNWWYDYLHDEKVVQKITIDNLDAPRDDRITRYYHQPDALGPYVENEEHLPKGYYKNLIAGKTDEWIRQWVRSEWGYDASGKPVVASFNPSIHVSKAPLIYNPNLPLIVGLDPGLGGSAFVFGQEDLQGRLLVLGELVQEGYGAERLIFERLKPYLRRRGFTEDPIIAPDPAANLRSQADEKPIIAVFKRHYTVKFVDMNNRLPERLGAIDFFTGGLTPAGPKLLIDGAECPNLVRALKGGWRFEMSKKEDHLKSPVPEKNNFSHVGDSFGYLCRFFHKQTQKELRYGGRAKWKPPQSWPNHYHFR